MVSKNYLPTFLVSIILLGLAFFLIGFYIDQREQQRQDERFLNASQQSKDYLQTLIENKQEKIAFIALSLAQDDSLAEAMMDQKNTISYSNFINQLHSHSNFKNIWVHIVDAKGTSFYRSWTSKRGDRILGKRTDLQQLFEFKKPQSSISTGIFDLTFKTTVPILHEGHFLGAFEVIAKFNSISKKLKKNKNIDAVFLVDKRYHKQIKYPFTKMFVGDYYVANLDANPNYFPIIQQEKLIEASYKTPYFINRKDNLYASFYSLPDMDGFPMGHFFLFQSLDSINDTSLEVEYLNLYIYTSLGYLFLLGLYFYVSNKRHTKQISEFNQHLTHTVNQKTQEVSSQKQFLQKIIDGVPDSVTVINREFNTILMNQAAKESLFIQQRHGRLNEEGDNLDSDEHTKFLNTLETCIETGDEMRTIYQHLDEETGLDCYYEVTVSPLKNEYGEITALIELGHDITGHLDTQKQLQQQKNDLDFMAYHDSLTHLPNRALFLDRLNQAINQGERSKRQVALLFIDLDRFKEINDSFGHDRGDDVLLACANRLKLCIRRTDTVARLGGDEFTVLLEGLENENNITDIVEKIIQELAVPILLNEDIFHITASIGISVYPNDGEDASQLLKNADAAMYQAKDDGKNTFHFYTREMTEQAFERVLMENNIREALNNEEFDLFYQPQYCLKDLSIIGFEALVRWNHPKIGMMSPDRFIPIAEETGLIIPLGKQILDMATKTIVEWHKQGLTNGRMAINVSARQLRDEQFLSILEDTLATNRCRPEWVELEITESAVMDNPEDAIKLLNHIRQKGIHVSIDDFGTGYSSLAYLKKLPITKVKIDRSFICNLPYDKDDIEITKAIISMSRSLNLIIIAEGIETEEQKEFVQTEGCHQMQGYLYSKPLEKSRVETLLNNHLSFLPESE